MAAGAADVQRGIERTLFVELLGGFGDLLIALPAVHALGRAYPRAAHEVLTFAPGAELLAADPYVDRVYAAPVSCARAAVARVLASSHYDVVVSDTCYEGIDRLVERYGAAHTVADLWRSPPAHVRVARRFLELLAADGLIPDEEAAAEDGRVYLTAAERAAGARLRAAGSPLVALVVDSGMAIKRWPGQRFVALGRTLIRTLGAKVLVVGGEREAEAERIASALGADARLWQRGTLRELAAALSHVDLAIGGDTGACRLAAAVGTRTLNLFGPSWHGRYGQPAPHMNLQGLSNCTERHPEDFTEHRCWYMGRCPLAGRRTCLEDLSAAAVAHAAAVLLRTGSAPPPPAGAEPASPTGAAPSSPGGADGDSTAARGRRRVRRALHKLAWRGRASVSRAPDWRRARRLLVVRADNIGDVVMAGPALRALKRALPDAGLTLLASPAGAAAAPLLPWLDATLTWRVLWQDIGGRAADPGEERRLISSLEAGRFDGAVILTSFSQTPHAPAAAAWLAGIPLRAGASKERSTLLTHTAEAGDDGRHQVERNLDLVRALGFPAQDDALELKVPDGARCGAAALLAVHGLGGGQPFVLLTPWTSTAARNYDAGRMVRAAKLVSAAAHLPIVVTAHARDTARAAELVERIGPEAVDLAGETLVTELAALVAGARLVLTNNTSVMHMADALRTPAVVLFAGTDLESQWAPRHTPHRLLRRPTRCSPCYAFACPLDHACLDIEPAEVADAALELLGETDGRRGGPHA